MREFDVKLLTKALSERIPEALCKVDGATLDGLKAAGKAEKNTAATWGLNAIIENARIAETTGSFACQDCGLAMVFLSVGREVHFSGNLADAVNEGVRRGYKTARKSAAHPLTRLNTGDNTPAVIHYDLVEGDGVTLSYLSKGAGAENMSKVYMLKPADGRKGIIDCVTDCVRDAGANPCPPVILGIGIGGTMDKAAVLSKYALLRETGSQSADADTAELEREILTAVNALGIGAQGFGGSATALAAHVETFETHIGMLPVAISMQCHSVRHFTVTL